MNEKRTDKDKLLAAIDFATNEWEEKEFSIYVKPSKIKLMFDKDGVLRSVIRGGKSYGPEGKR